MSEKTIKQYDNPAGGWGALRSVAKHLMEQDIAVQGAKTLLHANQPDGFDCPVAHGRIATTPPRSNSAKTAPRPWQPSPPRVAPGRNCSPRTA